MYQTDAIANLAAQYRNDMRDALKLVASNLLERQRELIPEEPDWQQIELLDHQIDQWLQMAMAALDKLEELDQ